MKSGTAWAVVAIANTGMAENRTSIVDFQSRIISGLPVVMVFRFYVPREITA
jgi:hypothetical protein